MRSTIATLLAGFVVICSGVAAGQEKTNPKQIVIGIAIFETNSEYVMYQVNGTSWDESYFEDEGKTLVLEGVDRTKEYVVVLTATDDTLKPEEIPIKPKEWKLARLDRETRQWQAKKKVKFRAWKPGEKEKLEARKRAEAEKKKAEEEAKKKAEPERKPEGDKKPEEERKPEGDKKPEEKRKPEGDNKAEE